MSLWDALRMNMMISYQELIRTFPKEITLSQLFSLSNFKPAATFSVVGLGKVRISGEILLG
jgi:hypothetical protein